MQVSVTLETAHGYPAIAAQLRDLANKLEGKPGATAAGPAASAPVAEATPPQAGATAAPKPRGRPPKAQAAAPKETPPADDGLGDLGGAVDDGLGEVSAAPAVEFSQVLDAFKDYAKRTSRAEAIKVMQRFGVTSVNDLPPETWGQALKAVEG